MIITLFGSPPKSVVVSKAMSEQIKEAIKAGAEYVEIGDNWFRASSVSSITPGGFTEGDVLPDDRHLTISKLPDNMPKTRKLSKGKL